MTLASKKFVSEYHLCQRGIVYNVNMEELADTAFIFIGSNQHVAPCL